MKRKFLVSGLLVCFLALGLIFVSCGDKSGFPFEGSWSYKYTSNNTPVEVIYKFTGTKFTMSRIGFQDFTDDSGSFKYTDTTITFSLPDYKDIWTQNYLLTDTYLQFTRIDPNDQHYAGRFNKK